MFVDPRNKETITKLRRAFNEKNALALPRLIKVVVSTATGRNRDKARQALVTDRLAKITGQKVSPRQAKKSIATFKLRQGEVIGFAVTLRGQRLYDFLSKLINIALPRTRDFRGLDRKSVDEMGNLTIGIREHAIFPETSEEDIKDIFSLSITVVTTARTRQSATIFLETIGFPFKKA
jgi:large subunit ribosomal protein L5